MIVSEVIIIRIYSLNVKITKVKAHGDCDYNKEADKLAKSGAEKNVLIIEDKLLLHNGTICWRDMPIERNPILMIKGIKDAQFIEEFLMLYRNKVYRQSDLLRIKICCNELPTCANLKKRKPDLYDKDWKCNFCKIEEETFDHFWKCSKIQNVVQDIIKGLKIFLVLKQITGRVLLEFKVLIWESRNELQIKEEIRCGISSKVKKAKSHSKSTEIDVKDVDCYILESNWNKWNDLAFHRGGHWANF
ncbi:hypothetical protein GLOIN_2v1767912 [Rhizophagus irregularis DAOM 181602=DAOM 197198]|nr:hypothetical protein GLOIN_2v1767912 [Rhizophagus irregularis DAOM 181602=DAOM 197198]